MISERIASLQELARQVRAGENFSYALRDFLDGFYASPQLQRVSAEPELLVEVLGDEGLADAYLAAVCDHLCRLFTLPSRRGFVPRAESWRSRISAQTHGLRMILLQESSDASRKRNIFCQRQCAFPRLNEWSRAVPV